jgi:hypothetical protein
MKRRSRVLSVVAVVAGATFAALQDIFRHSTKNTVAPGVHDAGTGPVTANRGDPTTSSGLVFDSIHFESGNLGRQIATRHHCTVLSPDLMQCALYDGSGPNARLVGIEYVISDRTFRQLPDDEKVLWHSHDYSVRSGLLGVPATTASDESRFCSAFQNTYGKVWWTWDSAREARVPLGIPRLMMAFTRDGQVDPGIVSQRDQAMETSTRKSRDARASLRGIEIPPGADAWEVGTIVQLDLARSGMIYRRPLNTG